MIWVIVKVSCFQSNEFMVRSQTFLRPTASQERVTPVVGTGIICSGPHRLLLQAQRQELSPRLMWVGCWRRLGAASAGERALHSCSAGQLSSAEGTGGEQGRTHPYVHFGPVIFLALEELWCGIGGAAAPRLQQLPRGEEVAEAKV